MICPKCNTYQEENRKFCVNCGTSLQAAPVQPMMQQPAQPVQPAPVQPMMQQSASVQPMAAQPVTNAQNGGLPNATIPLVNQPQYAGYTAPQPVQPAQPMAAQPAQPLYAQAAYGNQAATELAKEKKSKKGLIAIIAVLVVAIIGLVLFIILSGGNKNGKVADKGGTAGNGGGSASGPISQGQDPTYNNPPVDANSASATIMIYLVATNLESGSGYATSDIQEMLSLTNTGDVNIILETGGCLDWHNNYMTDGQVERFLIKNGDITRLENLGTIDMLEQDTLSDFITYCATNYPAQKYILDMWDHGGGVPIAFGLDENFPDSTLTEADLFYALKKAGIHFETILFDACLMSTLEIATAVRSYADYMVAAESSTAGYGLCYSDWIGELVAKPNSIKYIQTAVDSYMGSLNDLKYSGSMAAIQLDRIPAVYEAYVNYIDSVYKKVSNGDYANFAKARNDCGFYEGSDSVDLNTLANKYQTDKSSALIDALTNALYYTKSDFLFGHGLAAYFPNSTTSKYEYLVMYTEGRDCLVKLGYSDKILKFFDEYVSTKMDFMGWTREYAGNWYVASSFADANTGATQISVADSGSEGSYDYGDESGDSDGVLPISYVNGNQVIELTEEDWSIIDSVQVGLVYMASDGENAIVFGQDFYENTDDYGNILIDTPSYWECMNGNALSYIALDYYKDYETKQWSQTGAFFALVNGEESLVSIYYDEDYPMGILTGYTDYAFEGAYTSGYQYSFDYGDTIDLVYPIMNLETMAITYEALENPIRYENVELTYSALTLKNSAVCYYIINDIYGNEYMSDDIYY